MNTYKNVYGDNRVLIVCGEYEGMSRRCADFLYGEIASEVPYVLTICQADSLTKEQEKYYNIVAVGTRENNSYIKRLCDNGILSVPENEEGYRIKVCKNPENKEKQIYILAGGGEKGAYYAVSEFVNKYLPENESHDLHKLRLDPYFSKKTVEVDYENAPKITERGIWTWGHVIYDYKRLVDNMARLRMNIITVWNDFAPINAKEFVEYAHSAGIKVIWGFSMGWGYEYDISDDKVLDKIIDDAIKHYEDNYLHLDGDGIYFQTFTETNDDSKDGMNIAERVAMFVNKVNIKFKEKFGDIRLQFGLHATSVKKYLEEVGKVDSDVEIVWEDCGCFPYEYTPENVNDFEGTMKLTKSITSLRGENDKFSAVLKGLCCLEWLEFENQMSTYNMGVWSEKSIEKRYEGMKKFWRRTNALWLKNGEKAREIIEAIRQDKKGKTMIEALIEDGLIDEKINLSCAMMAQMMWDSERDIKDIIYEACLMPDVEI